MNDLRILIADDDPTLLRVLPDMLTLRMPDVVVDVADSAAAALEAIHLRDYDAIVSDIKMPGMDGITLLERARALRPQTPTLLITGHGEHNLAVQALRGGAFDFIQKPIDRDYFIASLSRAIRMRQITRLLDGQREALERRAAQLENLVEEQTRDLRAANQIKDQFLATLAHELRNPLAPIRNAVEVMRLRGTDDPTLVGSRDIIERQIAILSRLVDDLLDVSSITRGKLTLEKCPTDLVACVQSALEICRQFVAHREHQVVVEFAESPLMIDADHTRIEQIVANLVHNAAKYTEPGGRISIFAAREGHDVVLRVRDSGMGIAPEMLDRVFEPFAQAEQPIHRPRGGLGIGLTLVRQLVQMHGGEVKAASPGLGRGAEVVVRFPELARAASRGPERRPEGERARPAGGRRILIVEDNADSRESLKEVLELQGHVVDVAGDGAEGVEKALATKPDVALVDIGLPGINGYEVAERVRAQSDGAIYLIALTGYGAPADRRRASEAGFDAHLLKPVNFEALARLLEGLPVH